MDQTVCLCVRLTFDSDHEFAAVDIEQVQHSAAKALENWVESSMEGLYPGDDGYTRHIEVTQDWRQLIHCVRPQSMEV